MVKLPGWVTYPDDDWVTIGPEQAGLDPAKLKSFLDELEVRGAAFGGEDHGGRKWGAVVTRGGYLLHQWGDRHYRFQTASVGKAFARVLFGLAVEDGLVQPDDLVRDTWTGSGQLSHPHKYLDRDHHRTLTWTHLLGAREESGHYGGFAIELGNEWRAGRRSGGAVNWVMPEWAKWTGDPFYDCYSHVEPGTVRHYSSAGFWRLGQALTALWDRDLKDVLDERLFSRIGVPSTKWDWPTGGWIKDQKYFYPGIPDSYTYLDPPYEINGNAVRTCPGWVVISASDLARFGHLVATRGMWKGEQIVHPEWLRGHGGGNKSGSSGETTYLTAMGVVTTEGLEYQHSTATESFLPDDDDDPLTYSWVLTSKPLGSTASLTGANTATPSFTPDLLGDYVVELVVNDGTDDSDPDTVTITVQDTTAPTPTASLVPVGDDDDDDQLFRVEYSCSDNCDPNPTITSATLNGVPVANGQIVKLDLDDDEFEWEWDDGILEFEAPSFELVVTCQDASGNSATATATPTFAIDDDDNDGDNDDDDEDDDEDDDDDDDDKDEGDD